MHAEFPKQGRAHTPFVVGEDQGFEFSFIPDGIRNLAKRPLPKIQMPGVWSRHRRDTTAVSRTTLIRRILEA
jgi:hypothetical protein